MEQLMIEQQQAEQALETIEFGGVVWTLRKPSAINPEEWEGCANERQIRVHLYPNERYWKWQCEFKELEGKHELLTSRASCLVYSREEAMQAAIDASSRVKDYLVELVEVLGRLGAITESEYQRGFKAGQVDLKAKVLDL